MAGAFRAGSSHVGVYADDAGMMPIFLCCSCLLYCKCRFLKGYKSLSLGLVDIALLNAFAVHNATQQQKRRVTCSYDSFLAELHVQLISVNEKHFTETSRAMAADFLRSDQIAVTSEHTLVQSADTRINNGILRVRQRQCKVCSVYKPADKKRGGTSTFYCGKCSEGKKGLVTLCNRVRGHKDNESMTCAQIWHIVWQNGEFLPKLGHTRDRAVPKED
ncbi:hypothetical protein BBJ28_00014626 [Nothophytophthora sp. Chile5]|nr:hypothetical protein BBJ28_00014626 [Nothophytophthora sp. Chile5]